MTTMRSSGLVSNIVEAGNKRTGEQAEARGAGPNGGLEVKAQPYSEEASA